MLHIHSSNRAEILAKRLANVLREPLADPFQTEQVLVYSQGMERWLAMQLAEHLGICANVEFLFPVTYLVRLMAALVPDWDAEAARAYETQAMVWSLTEILPVLASQPGAESVANYLHEGSGPSDLRLYELAEQVAKAFDRYLIYRPQWLRRWEQNRFVPSEGWQAAAWRAVVARSGPWHRGDLRERFFVELAKPSANLAVLPSRLAVFGVSSLAPYFLEVLTALASKIDVHLFFLNPCQEYWGDILSQKQKAKRARRAPASLQRQLEFELASEPDFENELLANFALLGRDFLDLLLECEPSQHHEEFVEPAGQSLLATVQRDLLQLREGTAQVLEEEPSIRLFSCHGRMREIEVLHDTLLHLFESDPTLQPRDIVVMAPSIEDYTPKIHAIFGRPPEDERFMPYAISDRTGRAASSLGGLFLRLFSLADSRWLATDILGLLECEPIMRRFGLTEQSLDLLRQWVAGTAIRWGRDGEAKVPLGLPPAHENTWAFGLDRLVLGYAMPLENAQLYGGILPYDEIEGSDAEVLAKLLDFWERLSWLANLLAGEKSLAGWADTCLQMVGALLPAAAQDQRDLSMLGQVFEELLASALAVGHDGKVSVRVVKRFLETRLEETFGGSFLSGGVTFCNLLPMRCLPFRVVVLLGMSSDQFPRQERRLSFDLLQQGTSQRGDRSRLSEDRYLFLEALLAAREKLLLFYTGQTMRDNSELSPSVFVTQLRDYLVRVHGIPPERWIARHRLQPFSQAYFQNGPAFTYAKEYEPEVANRLAQWEQLPPPAEEPVLSLDALIRFYEHPVAAFFQERFGLREPPREIELSSLEPIDLNKLDRWHLDQWLLDLIQRGTKPAEIAALLRASGWLPHGSRQEMEITALERKANDFAERMARFFAGQAEPATVIDLLVGEQRLVGEVRGIHERGLCRCRFGAVRPRDKIRLWIEHLALQSMAPRRVNAHFLGDGPQPWIFDSYGTAPAALHELKNLVEIRERGRTKPLPLFPRASFAFAEKRLAERNGFAALNAARKVWSGEGIFPGEGGDFYHRQAFDPRRLPEEREFEQISQAVFHPLLRHGHFDDSF